MDHRHGQVCQPQGLVLLVKASLHLLKDLCALLQRDRRVILAFASLESLHHLQDLLKPLQSLILLAQPRLQGCTLMCESHHSVTLVLQLPGTLEAGRRGERERERERYGRGEGERQRGRSGQTYKIKA